MLIKKLNVLLCLFFIKNVFTQSNKIIYTNENNKVFLVFDSAIKQAMVGNSDYIFGYNRKTADKVGNLLCKKLAKKTNLFVITIDERMYSFMLEYAQKLKPEQMYHLIETNDAIKRKSIKPLKKSSSNDITLSESNPITNENYDFHYVEKKGNKITYEDNCKLIINKNEKYYLRQFRVVDDIFFRLKNYYYKDEELYFLFELDNQSSIDFDINFIRFYTNTKKKKKRSLSQRVYLGINGKADYTHNLPKRVKANTKIIFVSVLKKLSLNANKALLVNLSELKGERVIELEFDSKIINHPQKI